MSHPLREPASIQRLAPLTASQRVRERLRSAGTRFHANDNIADYLEDGDLEAIEGFSRDTCKNAPQKSNSFVASIS